MKAVRFKECNVKFAASQPQYKTLDALRIDNDRADVITCWKPNFMERIRLLFGGKVWLTLLTFNNPLQPILLSTNKKNHFTKTKIK